MRRHSARVRRGSALPSCRGAIPWGGVAAALAFALLANPGGPAELSAQQMAGDCQLMDTFRTLERREITPGVSIVWISRPDLRCPDGRRIQADSAVVYEAQGRNELIGNVRFTQPGRELRSVNADWYEREGRLFARGNVVFLDREEGSEVRGDTLVFLEARGTREEQVTVYGGRPSATLPIAAEPGAPEAEPYRVVANRLRFQGDRFFWGDGEVEVTRDELRATADSLAYDRTVETLILNRDARVERDGVVATGGNLNVVFDDGTLSGLVARRGGRIVTEDADLAGLEVRVELGENEEVREVLAQGGEDPETGSWILATLEAENLRVEARDQVEIRDEEDGGRIMVATGDARAESLGRGFGREADPDGPSREELPDLPEAAGSPGMPSGVPDRDWVEGDRIEAFFEPVPPEGAVSDEDPAPDAIDPDDPEAQVRAEGSAEGGDANAYRLTRLVATGSARALYRSPPEGNGEGEGAPEATDAPPEAMEGEIARSEWRLWPISYILADLITIHLVEGEVRFLEAEGNVRGLQLEPGNGGSE
jgi:lipopolysaccharide export system protein LptA